MLKQSWSEREGQYRLFGNHDAMVWLHVGFQDEAGCQAISYAIKKGGRVKEKLHNK